MAGCPAGAEGWLNWSSRIDVAVQVAGLGLWAVGMIVLVCAVRVMRRYMAVDGVTEDHELATEEETLLGSPEGLGDTYRSHREGTGRSLPRLVRVRR